MSTLVQRYSCLYMSPIVGHVVLQTVLGFSESSWLEMAIESSRASNRTFLLEARNFRVRSSRILRHLSSRTKHLACLTRFFEQRILSCSTRLDSINSSRIIEHARSKSNLCSWQHYRPTYAKACIPSSLNCQRIFNVHGLTWEPKIQGLLDISWTSLK
jgi:hypothetical protein